MLVSVSSPIGGAVECDVFSGLAATGSGLAAVLLLGGAVLVGVTRRRRARAAA